MGDQQHDDKPREPILKAWNQRTIIAVAQYVAIFAFVLYCWLRFA